MVFKTFYSAEWCYRWKKIILIFDLIVSVSGFLCHQNPPARSPSRLPVWRLLTQRVWLPGQRFCSWLFFASSKPSCPCFVGYSSLIFSVTCVPCRCYILFCLQLCNPVYKGLPLYIILDITSHVYRASCLQIENKQSRFCLLTFDKWHWQPRTRQLK